MCPAVGGDNSDLMVFLVVVTLRFVIPLFIPRFPLPAILAALVLDAADQTIFQQWTNLDLDGYQNYDKALDIYYLTIAFLAVYRNWANTMAINVARFLWYYRLFGVWLFEVLQHRWLLFVFPNTFEYYFIAFVAIRTSWDPRRLTNRMVIAIAGFIWIVVKLPQEWWIHIAQNDFTDFMKETVFGVQTTDSWGEGLTNRPLVTLALVAAVAGAAALAVWLYRRSPEPDWSFTVDVDEPVPAVDLPPQPALWFAPPFAEKVLLLGLIAAIYANVLEVDATLVQIVGATIALVAVSLFVSEFLARRGVEWRSLGVEFVVLGVVNAVVLSIYARLFGDGLNRSLSLFFGLLLTMIIVLYDRFLGARTGRLERVRGIHSEPASA
jgi:hypothetical protein